MSLPVFPVSDKVAPYLFILAVESLVNQIRNNQNIKGIIVNGIKHVISLYADDTSLFLVGDATSFKECLHIFEKFRLLSGLKVNFDKTEVMPTNGSCNHRKKFEEIGLRWNMGPINTLGVQIWPNLDKMVKVNYEAKLGNMKSAIKMWASRNLSLMGKIIIIKSQVLSQIIYLLQCLPLPE